MRLPKFTAEASLYTSAEHYQVAASPSVSEGAGGVVTPQQSRRGRRWRCWDERIQGVLVRCCQVEGQEPFCWFDHVGYPGMPV